MAETPRMLKYQITCGDDLSIELNQNDDFLATVFPLIREFVLRIEYMTNPDSGLRNSDIDSFLENNCPICDGFGFAELFVSNAGDHVMKVNVPVLTYDPDEENVTELLEYDGYGIITPVKFSKLCNTDSFVSSKINENFSNYERQKPTDEVWIRIGSGNFHYHYNMADLTRYSLYDTPKIYRKLVASRQ